MRPEALTQTGFKLMVRDNQTLSYLFEMTSISGAMCVRQSLTFARCSTLETTEKVCPQIVLLKAKMPVMKSYQKISWLGVHKSCECRLTSKNM